MNLLVTGAWKCTEEQLSEIKRMGHNVAFLQQEKDPLPCNYDWVEGTICNALFLTHSISKFQNLKYIQTTSAGLDRIPLDYCQKHSIIVNNAKGVYSIPMTEFAISGVLDLLKKKESFFKHQFEHKWVKERDLLELNGMTVLIIGCGSVGIECAKRFSSFGCKIIGVDVISIKNDYFETTSSIDNLQFVIPNADVLILTLPLTDNTKGLINKNIINKMKKTAIIVNISRGGIIDSPDLIDSLKAGQIYGAVLDVFEEEPLNQNSPMWDLDNVILTPHNSYVSNNNNDRLFQLILKNLGQKL